MAGTTFSRQDIIDFDLLLSDAYATSYQQALASKDNWFTRMARYTPSQNREVRFPFPYNTVGTKRQNIGEPPYFAHLEMQNVNIRCAQYQGGAEIHETEFANDMIQQNTLEQVETLALNNVFDPLYRACDILREGDSNAEFTTYDGELLFSQNHKVGISDFPWSNLFSGTLFDENALGATFNEVKSNMRQIPWGPGGRYLPTSGAKWYILVPPTQEIAAQKLVNNTYYLQRDLVGDNPFKGIADIIVEENLVNTSDPTNLDWYVLMTIPGRMPFVHLEQTIPRAKALISHIDPKDENVKQNGMYQWTTINYMEVFPAQYFLLTKVLQAS